MTLKEKITDHKLFALRNGDKEMRLVLSTLLGEVDNKIGKDPTDIEIIKIIKKMIANNKLTNTEEENKYLELYLPKMIPNDELNARIKHFIEKLENPTIRSIRDVMDFLNENYPGQYDSKIAAICAKNLLL